MKRFFVNSFNNMKAEILHEFEKVILNPETNIHTLLEKTHNSLVEKTSYLINNNLPKYNQQQSSLIIENIQDVYKSLKNDYTKIVTSLDNNNVKEFVQNFDLKLSMLMQNLQQPIYSSLTNMEDRITSKMSAIQKNVDSANAALPDKVLRVITDNLENISPAQRNICISPISPPVKVILTPLFPSAEILSDKIDSNLFILKRLRKTNIIMKSFDSKENVTTNDIFNFMETIEDANSNGILISHNSGISTKSNYEIGIHNNRVFVYLHKVKYNGDIIASAVDIIDELTNKLLQYTDEKDKIMSIPKDIMDNINSEYHTFITQKIALVDMLKEQHKLVVSQIGEFRFPSLDKYLSSHYIIPVSKPGLKCDLCKLYSANNLKALAAHKRGCIRKRALD